MRRRWIFAAFDGPGRAVRCALAMVDAAHAVKVGASSGGRRAAAAWQRDVRADQGRRAGVERRPGECDECELGAVEQDDECAVAVRTPELDQRFAAAHVRASQYAVSVRIAAAIFAGESMNASSSGRAFGEAGDSGPARRVTGPSR